MTVPVSAYLLQLHTVHKVAIPLALYTVAQYTISMQLHKKKNIVITKMLFKD